MIGLSAISSNTGYQIDVTMDDPFGFFPNPTLNPGSALNTQQGGGFAGQGGKTVTVFQSSQVGGWGGAASSAASQNNAGYCFGAFAGGSANQQIGGIDQPISAFRLTISSAVAVAGSPATLSYIQAGPR
jgi:hypothetical protein